MRYVVGDLVVDIGRERVTRDGHEIPLNKLSFDLLTNLVRAAPDLVSTAALMQGVWPGLVVGSETVSQRISRLRSALQDDPKAPRYVAGVRGRGYRIVAPVARHDEPETSPAPTPVADLPPSRLSIGKIIACMVVLAVLVSGLTWYFTHSPGGTASRTPPPIRASSIAVIPFANLTGDPAKEYFGDGLAEELIDSLARMPGLKVPARTSSFAYKGHSADVRRIARELGVSTVLEGSVRSAGERVRVSAQLIDARTGYHLWSQSYDRQLVDIFKLQDELAAAIQQALRGNLNAPIPVRPERLSPTQDVEAYLLYLRARASTVPTEAGFRATVALYDQALARDPRFARALAGRAFTGVRIALFGYPVANALEDAERDARQALVLEPELGAAHSALAEASAMRTNWLEADVHFRAALKADPADPLTHGNYAVEVLAPAGRLREAQSQASEGFRLAPGDQNAIVNRAVVSWCSGLDRDAISVLDLGRTLFGSSSPEYPPIPEIRAAAAARAGRYTQAAELIVQGLHPRIRDAGGADVTRAVYSALGDVARKPAAARALRELVHKLAGSQIDPLAYRDFIVEFVMLGAIDEAYDLADGYLKEFGEAGTGSGAAWSFLWLPEMRAFRVDPRFQTFAERLNLLAYWEQHGSPDTCDLKARKLTCR